MVARQTESNATDQAEGRQGLKRRGILAAAGAVVAGIAAKQMAEPVAAVDVFSIPGDYTASAIGTVWKITNTGSGDAIRGLGTSQGVGGGATGAGGTGVFGGADVANGIGVYGRNTTGGNSTGVQGAAGGSFSISNTSGFPIGVHGGVSGNGFGVYGQAVNGTGTYGIATGGGYGVYGVGGTGYGVVGFTGGTGVISGVYGSSATAYGIIGSTTAAGYSGLTAITSTPNVAALGATATVPTAFAAFFTGTTVVNGDFAVTGNKSAAALHPDGTHRLLYCVESPEAWFEDFGEAKLVGGKAEVKLDADFAALVHADTYHVFITGHDKNSEGHVVTVRRADGFIVEERKGGASSGTFSWRVVAKRKDNPGKRLEKFSLPKIAHPDPDKLPKPETPKKP